MARDKFYDVSSVHNDSYFPHAVPSHAANGNTSGVYSADNCIHTRPYHDSPDIDYLDVEDWWSVDLGKVSTIYSLKVYGRNGCM
jgi:hypothetical protein